MKRFSLFLFALGFAAMAGAQTTPAPEKTPEQRTQKVVDWMKTNIGLKPEQEPKVYHVVLTSFQDLKKAKETYGNQKELFRQKRKAIKEKSKSELKSILTPEQWQQLEQKKKEMRQHMKDRKKQKQDKTTGDSGPEKPEDLDLF